jgi:hypothetical protein
MPSKNAHKLPVRYDWMQNLVVNVESLRKNYLKAMKTNRKKANKIE